MHAVNKGYLLLVEPLLEAKADPNVRAPDGATALFMAAVHGHTDIIVMLMKAGASVSVRGPKGKTAVEVARDEVRRARGGTGERRGPRGARLAGRQDMGGGAGGGSPAGGRRCLGACAAAGDRGGRMRSTQGRTPRGVTWARPNGARRHCRPGRNVDSVWHASGRAAGSCATAEVCPEMVVIPAGKYRMGLAVPRNGTGRCRRSRARCDDMGAARGGDP